MKQDRRHFLKTSALAAAAMAVSSLTRSAVSNDKSTLPVANAREKVGLHAASTRKRQNIMNSSSNMKLSWIPYDLQLNHTFTISGFSRKTTPVVLTKIELDGVEGYGEASLPPYLGESQASVIEFLKKVDLSSFSDPTHIEEIFGVCRWYYCE
jgi:L-alanine-DL-glutamate epimerase and related enzymes of enolase superfamily